MNHLLHLSNLKNEYFILRHGKSLANEIGKIVSHPKDGTKSYGLTKEGRGQVEKTITEAIDKKILDSETIIISSDFKRARETAEIAKNILKTQPIILKINLRERYFGDWDQTDHNNYKETWSLDSSDASHKIKNVESVNEVVKRATEMIKELENKHSNKKILLVSHGDTLQILQTAFEKVDGKNHRSFPHLETAGLRKLNLK